MSDHGRPRAPAGLAARGRRLWRQTVEQYDLRADERAVLQELCRCADDLDKIQAELAGAPLMVPGSTGQMRPHPLLAEARAARQTFAALARLLGLSDVAADDVPDTPAQVRAKRAAAARWGHRRGSA